VPSDDRVPADERARRMRAEPAQRMLAAAGRLVGQVGVERARVTDIAREAGVARGAIFYYFGTKERLLAELLRADAEARIARLREHLEQAGSLDELVAGLTRHLSAFLDEDRLAHGVLQELRALGLRHPDMGRAWAQWRARYREALAEVLRAKAAAGVVRLRHPAEATAGVILALGAGVASDALADPSWDAEPTRRAARDAVRWLLDAARVDGAERGAATPAARTATTPR
jgi:AcrR family transcriptional regulator